MIRRSPKIKRRRISLFRMRCFSCGKGWGATPKAMHRDCPFCGSSYTAQRKEHL